MPPIPYLPAALFLFLGIPGASAQSDPPPAKDPSRSFRIAVSSLPPSTGKELFYRDGENFAAVPLDLYKFSPPQPLSEDATSLQLFREIPSPDVADPAPDLAVPLPASAKKILVVVFPGTAPDTTHLAAHAIDESDFPPGSIYFFNPTKIPLAALLGEEKITIPPGKNFLFRPPALGPGKTFAVQIALHEEEGWKLFSSTRWHLAPTERHLLFFKINPRTRRADYDSLTDYFKPPAG